MATEAERDALDVNPPEGGETGATWFSHENIHSGRHWFFREAGDWRWAIVPPGDHVRVLRDESEHRGWKQVSWPRVPSLARDPIDASYVINSMRERPAMGVHDMTVVEVIAQLPPQLHETVRANTEQEIRSLHRFIEEQVPLSEETKATVAELGDHLEQLHAQYERAFGHAVALRVTAVE